LLPVAFAGQDGPNSSKVRSESRVRLLTRRLRRGRIGKAMRFRGTRDDSEGDKVAAQYEHVVHDLITSGKWEEMPSLEDMLPDERMPEAFFKFWSIPVPHYRRGLNGKH